MTIILKNFEFDNALCVFAVSGEVSATEILREIRIADFAAQSTILLWDFSRGSVRWGTEAPWPAMPAQTLYRQFSGLKAAIVSPNELDYGLYRILQVFKTVWHFPSELRIFRSNKAGRRWLGACRLCSQQLSPDQVQNKPCFARCSPNRRQ